VAPGVDQQHQHPAEAEDGLRQQRDQRVDRDVDVERPHHGALRWEIS